MTRRPLGITLLAATLALVGFGAIVLGASLLGGAGAVDPAPPPTIRWFLLGLPLALLGWGAVGLVAAVGLWRGTAWGRTAGLWVLGAWAVEELVSLGALLVGWPPGVDLALSPLAVVIRLAVASLLLRYLWRLPWGTEPAADDAVTPSDR